MLMRLPLLLCQFIYALHSSFPALLYIDSVSYFISCTDRISSFILSYLFINFLISYLFTCHIIDEFISGIISYLSLFILFLLIFHNGNLQSTQCNPALKFHFKKKLASSIGLEANKSLAFKLCSPLISHAYDFL